MSTVKHVLITVATVAAAMAVIYRIGPVRRFVTNSTT